MPGWLLFDKYLPLTGINYLSVDLNCQTSAPCNDQKVFIVRLSIRIKWTTPDWSESA